MKSNENVELSSCSSAQNLARIKRQQQQMSQQFRLANFVTYGKLDLLSLKNKIASIRSQKNVTKLHKDHQNKLQHQADPSCQHKQTQIESNREEYKTIERSESKEDRQGSSRENKEKWLSKRIHTEIQKPQQLMQHSSKQKYKKEKLKTSKSHNSKIKSFGNYIKKMSVPKSSNLNKSMELAKNNEYKSQRRLQTNYQTICKQQSQHEHKMQHKSIHKFTHCQTHKQNAQHQNLHIASSSHDHQIKIRSQRTIPKSLIKTITTQQNEQSQYKIHNIGKRQYSISKKIPWQQGNHKMTLSPFNKKKAKIILISNKQQLLKLENNIENVWSLYQLLSQITAPLSENRYSLLTDSPNFQHFILKLNSYRNMVCSLKYEFLISIVNSCLELYQARTVFLSRLQESLSILYIFLAIMPNTNKDNQKQILFSCLVNFVGIASQNLLLLIKLLQLVHNVDTSTQSSRNTGTGSSPSFIYSEKIIKILDTISKFQKESYLSQIDSKKEIVLRIEHNNETISIIQNKLNALLQNQQYNIKSINQFVKLEIHQRFNKDIFIMPLAIREGASQQKKQTLQKKAQNEAEKKKPLIKPLFEYSFFIFEYLAYRIHQSNLHHTLNKQISTAPSPYISFSKDFTIFINVIDVCTKQKQNQILIRPYTHKFITYLKSQFNLVFWTHLKPNQADYLFDILEDHNKCSQPSEQLPHRKLADFETKHVEFGRKSEIKRLYEHHCLPVSAPSCSQQEWIKDIERTGCQQNKYVIIDTNWKQYYEKQRTKILLAPWKKSSKDYHLNTILNMFKANSNKPHEVCGTINGMKTLGKIKSMNSFLHQQTQ